MLPPNPALHRLWREASAAGRVMGRIRALEEKWVSLFGSTSDLLILNEESLVRPLMEFLGIDELLAGVIARSVTEDRHKGESHVAAQRLPAESLGDRQANRAASLPRPADVPLARRPQASAAAGAKTKATGIVVEEIGPTPRGPEQASVRAVSSITRAEAREHFAEMSDHAGVRSAWDKLVIATTGGRHKLDGPGLMSDAESVAGTQPLNAEHAITHEKSNGELPSKSAFSPRAVSTAAIPAKASIRPGDADPNGVEIIDVEPAANSLGLSEDRLERILGPLVERTIRSRHHRLSRTRVASRKAGRGPSGSPEPGDARVTHEIPLTGLRRLAASAMSAGDVSAVERNRQIMVDDEREPFEIPEGPMTRRTSGEDAEFASQLADFLRRETLRHGIAIEGVQA